MLFIYRHMRISAALAAFLVEQNTISKWGWPATRAPCLISWRTDIRLHFAELLL